MMKTVQIEQDDFSFFFMAMDLMKIHFLEKTTTWTDFSALSCSLASNLWYRKILLITYQYLLINYSTAFNVCEWILNGEN